jgi:hypothetical protein
LNRGRAANKEEDQGAQHLGEKEKVGALVLVRAVAREAGKSGVFFRLRPHKETLTVECQRV